MAFNFLVHSLLRARDWHHRPQLDAVCDWWRSGGHGVMALVGIGGAGKTAIVEHFLRVLPGGLPTDLQTPKDKTLPPPNCIFVFSFNEAPNLEAYFASLQAWLKRSPYSKQARSADQMPISFPQSSSLLVLDSLDKAQDGERRHSSPHEIAHAQLRKLLTQIVNGHLPNVSVLLTSRFELSCLAPKASRYNPPVVVPPYCLSVLKENLKHHFHNHPKGKAGCFLRMVGRQLNILTLRVWDLDESSLSRFWLFFEARIIFESVDVISVNVDTVKKASGLFRPKLSHYVDDLSLMESVRIYLDDVLARVSTISETL